MFQKLLDDEIKRRGISYRKAAKEIGISHTTLIGATKGTRVIDTETATAICRWLGVPLTTFTGDADNKTISALAVILKAAPDLAKVFEDAATELERGVLKLEDMEELVKYAAYLIHQRREKLNREQERFATTHQASRDDGR